MSRKSNRTTRRDFLKGKSAVESAADLGRVVESSGEHDSRTPSTRSYLIQVGRRAMACQFDVLLNAGEHEFGTEQAIVALDLIETLEEQLSVYRHRSEVSQLNGLAWHGPVRVESRLFDLLQTSLKLFQMTGGAFDITARPLIQIWRAARQNGLLPEELVIREALDRVGSDKIRLDDGECSVRFLKSGVSVDLGGIGKGYALDRCAEKLTAAGLPDYMMHGGSSSIVARGQRQSGTDDPGWTVGVQHPQRPDRRFLELQLCDQAIGTSGAGTHQFFIAGKRYGHILDPRTGYPVEGVVSTTVVANHAATADALSTSFYVMGLDGIDHFCQQHQDIAAFVMTSGDRSDAIDLHTFNADRVQWRSRRDIR